MREEMREKKEKREIREREWEKFGIHYQDIDVFTITISCIYMTNTKRK